MNKRSLMLSFGAALLSGLLVYGVYTLLLKQVELQKTVNVVVPKQFVPAGSILTEDMLQYQPVYIGAFHPGMFRNISDVAGQETMVPLGTNEPILAWKLDRLHLLPDERQSTFQIPKQYLLSVSNGIRAGDKVRVYVSDPVSGPYRLFPHEITVASVKSSNNVEVDNPKNSNLLSRSSGDAEKMYVSRLEATGPIDQINLILTEEEWLLLDRTCSAGNAKLVIAFTSASITEVEAMAGANRAMRANPPQANE
mgnify:CR=1 FL=1